MFSTLYPFVRDQLFRMDAEDAHHLSLRMIGAAGRTGMAGLFAPRVPDSPRTVMGLTFRNPVGLAAGLDKEGAAIDGFAALKDKQQRLADMHGKLVPLALKIAPDLDDEQVKEIADTLLRHKIEGVIATNTTLSRAAVEGLPNASETGGLSGRPVFDASNEVIRKLRAELGEQVPIIGVGGIFSGDDAREKIAAGASLVQVYTGFIYRGPALVAECARALASGRA